MHRADFENRRIQTMMTMLESSLMRNELAELIGYDTSDMGRIASVD